jgi:hypothetical protein
MTAVRTKEMTGLFLSKVIKRRHPAVFRDLLFLIVYMKDKRVTKCSMAAFYLVVSL